MKEPKIKNCITRTGKLSMRQIRFLLLAVIFLNLVMEANANNSSYRKLNMAIYCPARDIQRMEDPVWLEESFDLLQKSIMIDNVYLETYCLILFTLI